MAPRSDLHCQAYQPAGPTTATRGYTLPAAVWDPRTLAGQLPLESQTELGGGQEKYNPEKVFKLVLPIVILGAMLASAELGRATEMGMMMRGVGVGVGVVLTLVTHRDMNEGPALCPRSCPDLCVVMPRRRNDRTTPSSWSLHCGARTGRGRDGPVRG